MARPSLDRNVKYKTLIRTLKLPRPYVRGLLEVMWDTAHESGNPILGTPQDVESAAEWPGEQGVLFEALCAGRWIDQTENGEWQIHDYWDHAPGYASSRALREKERKKEKVCGYCASPFHSSSSTAKFCSESCRVLNHRAQSKQSPGEVNAELTDGNVNLTEVNTTPNTQHPLHNTPLPPKGGKRARKKKHTGEEEAIAQEVVDTYQKSIQPAHGIDGAKHNVLTLLGGGYSKDQLIRCIGGYAAECQQNGTQPKYRMKARNFFGKDAGYEAYLNSKTQAEIAAEEKAQRAAQYLADQEEGKRQAEQALPPEVAAAMFRKARTSGSNGDRDHDK